MQILFTDYCLARLEFRRIPEATVRSILTVSAERYFDNETYRHIAVGKADFGRKGKRFLAVAYEQDGDILATVTVHDVTRAQVTQRVKDQRWTPQ